MKLDDVVYALAKQVPDMRDDVVLRTAYGEIELYDDDAARVAEVVKRIMQEKYRRLRAEEAAK